MSRASRQCLNVSTHTFMSKQCPDVSTCLDNAYMCTKCLDMSLCPMSQCV